MSTNTDLQLRLEREIEKIYEEHFLFTFGRTIVFCHNKARRLLLPQAVNMALQVFMFCTKTGGISVDRIIFPSYLPDRDIITCASDTHQHTNK